MKVALTVNDFLRRAELVYPDRVAIVDEPDQPAESLGSDHVPRDGPAGTCDGRRASTSSGSGSASGSRWSATTRPVCSPRCSACRDPAASWCRSTSVSSPPRSQYIVEHSGARLLLVDPELADALADVECERKLIIGAESDAVLMKFDVEPRPWERRRGRHGDDQLHVGHDRPTEGRAAHPPQRVDQRHDVRLAHGGDRPRRVPAHAPPVPLQRLGHALRRQRDGRQARHHPQGRRPRDPAARRASTGSR